MLRSKPLTLVVFAMALVLLVLVIVGEGKAGPPEAVYSAASMYASYRTSLGQGNVAIERIVRASQPSNFVPEMSKVTYADSVYYRTTHSLANLAQGQPDTASKGVRPVPFPPLNLWCVQLSNGTVVLIGEHHDLHNADYIIHEPVDPQTNLASVGCDRR